VGQFRSADGLVLLSGRSLGPQMYLPLANSLRLTSGAFAFSPATGGIMRWISTFDRYDLILAAAISGLFAVVLSFGFI
jgi:hypothetical protein